MDKLNTNYSLNYIPLNQPGAYAKKESALRDILEIQQEQSDSFEQGAGNPRIGYENFSIYRKVSSSLEKLKNADIPSDGVPSAVLLKSTLEAIEAELALNSDTPDNGNFPENGNPYILMDLLDKIVDKA